MSGLEASIVNAVGRVAAHLAKKIARSMEREITRRLSAELKSPVSKRGAGAKGRRSSPKSELTKWTADRRARRVPKFVIELTGLDTKKKIVAKFGADAHFERGQAVPVPKAAHSPAKTVERVVRSKPPVIRKAAAAGK